LKKKRENVKNGPPKSRKGRRPVGERKPKKAPISRNADGENATSHKESIPAIKPIEGKDWIEK